MLGQTLQPNQTLVERWTLTYTREGRDLSGPHICRADIAVNGTLITGCGKARDVETAKLDCLLMLSANHVLVAGEHNAEYPDDALPLISDDSLTKAINLLRREQRRRKAVPEPVVGKVP